MFCFMINPLIIVSLFCVFCYNGHVLIALSLNYKLNYLHFAKSTLSQVSKILLQWCIFFYKIFHNTDHIQAELLQFV